jgi:hypothetical protein
LAVLVAVVEVAMAVLQVLVGLDTFPPAPSTAWLAVLLEEVVVEVAVRGQTPSAIRTLACHRAEEQEEVTKAATVETINFSAHLPPKVVCANIILAHLTLQPSIALSPPLNLLQLRLL